jgi:hypothetical protein
MKPIIFTCVVLAAGFYGGCFKPEGATASKTKTAPKHEHHPPHGGTPVELGGGEYHIEFVLDAPNGRLQAFVLDGELENFVRIAVPTFEVVAQVAGREETLSFTPVANRATGETVGDSALFETQADWLKTATTFDAVITELTVRGNQYRNIAFNFPKGNDTDEKEEEKKP